jgi:hypothetical protein
MKDFKLTAKKKENYLEALDRMKNKPHRTQSEIKKIEDLIKFIKSQKVVRK